MVSAIHETQIEQLRVAQYPSNQAMGRAAAAEAAEVIRQAIAARGEANIILATGNSQLTFLRALREDREIEWSQVRVFHMDEYVGLDPEHPASFPQFLHRHFLDYVTGAAFYPVEAPVEATDIACQTYERLLRHHPADLCACGIGENGHLAFNDPPYADFDDPRWVKVVQLDERSRRQQVGEGHFASLDEVPTHAVTLTIPALLAAGRVLCIVPEARKAEAVKAALYGPVTEDCPASILRTQGHARLYLDPDSGRPVDWDTGKFVEP
ncbi:MAG: glucosamine-6-phosphate deaminase [Caldilineales bacterium]